MKVTAKIARVLCVVLACFVFVSCSGNIYSNNSKTVLTINGYKVSYDEYKYFYVTKALAMIEDGIDEFDDDALEKLEQETLCALREMYAVISLADKYDISLSKTDIDAIKSEIQYYVDEQGGLKEYKELLEEENMSGKVFYDQFAYAYFIDPYLREFLFTGYDHIIKMDNATVKQDVMDNFYRYTEIVLSYDQTIGSTTNYNKIISAYDELQNGRDFFEVARQYSEEIMKIDIGIYSTRGEKIAIIEDTVLALNVGEYSEVIITEKGYHILLRLDLDEAYVDENITLFSLPSATRRYHEYITEYALTLEVKYKKYFNKLTHETLMG